MKYTGRCTNDFTGRGWARREEAGRAESAEEDRNGLDEDKQNHAYISFVAHACKLSWQ